MSLTKEQRDALPPEHFAVPGKRKLPIHDETHVKLAWDMVDRTQGLSDEERAEARRRILHRAKELGVSTKEWHVQAALEFVAMALDVPATPGHPNKMPFSGVLTFIDKPSDNPVGGALGRRTIITKAAAEAALPSLLGMAVDFKPELDGHDKKSKIGLITSADIVGDELRISGFLYAADFPEECERIRAEKGALGFSYECLARIQSQSSDPWVIDSLTFTGAAILKKDLAAYTHTSLAARADEDTMNAEELKKLNESIAILTASVKTLGEGLDEMKKKVMQAGNAVLDQVKPHAEKLRSCAAAMEAAGIGLHKDRGHVKVLNHMADHMEAEATLGRLPHIYNDHSYFGAGAERTVQAEQDPATKKALETLSASLAAVETGLKDLTAKAFQAASEPARKTLSGEIKTLLDKHGLTASAEKGELTLAEVDKTLKAAGVTGRDAIAAKLNLRAAGVLKAA